jgi:16S rRNA processing protein RimM
MVMRSAPAFAKGTWAHGPRLILHFAGVDSIDAAKALVGGRLFLAEAELPPLPDGAFYTFRIRGARVLDVAGRELGRVVDTQEAPGQDLLVMQRPDGGQALIPLTGAIVRQVDLEAGVVVVDAPPGLLEGEPEVVRETP